MDLNPTAQTAPPVAPFSPAIGEFAVIATAAQDAVVRAAKDLRVLELRGEFQTDAWWDALNRVRDAADRIDGVIAEAVSAA